MALDRLFGDKAFQDLDALWTGHAVLMVCTEVEILGHALIALRFNHTVFPLRSCKNTKKGVITLKSLLSLIVAGYDHIRVILNVLI